MQPNLATLLNQIPSATLADRLVQARNKQKIVQQEAADTLGISRPTFINIEKGQRRLTPSELLKLAELYAVDASSLVTTDQDGFDLTVQFRHDLEKHDLGLGVKLDALDTAIKQLQEMAIAYRELEQMLGKKRHFNVPTQYSLSGHRDLKAYAAQVARQERARLQLGDEPVPQLAQVLEEEFGVRVFRFPMPSWVSGFYGYAPGLGGCIALNEGHPPERQLHTLGHEKGHLLTAAQSVQVQVQSTRTKNTPEEQFAGAFGMHFTLPELGVKKLVFDCIERNDGQAPSITDLVAMSHYYGVSFEAFLRRLVDLGFLPSGDVKRLTSMKVVKETKQNLSLTSNQVVSELDQILARYPERYKQYVVEAYEKDLLESNDIIGRYLIGIRHSDIAKVIDSYTQVTHMDQDGSVIRLNFKGYQELLNWRLP
jgi:Zn-dependent peptidase ImmA (M78 family)/transcriptional regulator with XRE-family HTH domain